MPLTLEKEQGLHDVQSFYGKSKRAARKREARRNGVSRSKDGSGMARTGGVETRRIASPPR